MIGIICAMQEEVKSVLNILKDIEKTQKGQRNYFSGTLYEQHVVIVFSRWGKVAAAATTTQLINDFNPTEIIFTGVAGGLNSSLNIGDIVIGQDLFQHDMNATPFYQEFHIPILDLKSVSTRNTQDLFDASSKFIENYDSYINKTESDNFEILNPKVIIGDIASGDQFISSVEKINKIKNDLPSVTCVEMEGAAVAQVCYEYDTPFSIVRIISDKANDTAHIDFERFVNNIASKYALGILENYLT
jgi:adenosylhomocysteine nucleosidase